MSRFTALGEMASTLAHEINQPLTAINNYLKGCQRLLQSVEGEQVPALRDALAKAADQALRAGQIIRRLREFVARGESERRVENLPKLIEDASTLALVGTRENAIAVSFRLDPAAELVLVDRIQIQQVLVNLIRNAIEVMLEIAEPRELEIETRWRSDGHGAGQRRRYGRGPRARSRGASLSAVRHHQAEGHGPGPVDLPDHHRGAWRQDLGRPAAGGGTIFRFTLRVPERIRGGRAWPSNDIVHVIDDDADVRQSLAFLLSTAGWRCACTNSATAFLEALPEIQDGCIVTDVRMPGMDGIELQRRLRARQSRCR